MADAFVESKIRDGRVTLFIKPDCSYCRNACDILKKYDFVYGGLKVYDISGREDIQETLQRRTRQRTVPYVFFGRSCIGGLAELQSKSSYLPRMLQQIGALK